MIDKKKAKDEQNNTLKKEMVKNTHQDMGKCEHLHRNEVKLNKTR